MSETPQVIVTRWLDEGSAKLTTPPEIRDAIRAVLDLVRVQYEANEEMTRLLSESRHEWPEVAAAQLLRAEQLFSAVEIIERQAEVLGRRNGTDDRPVDTIKLECMKLYAALAAVEGWNRADRREATMTPDISRLGWAATITALRAEADSLRDRLSSVTEDYIKHRNALERAEAALLEWREAAACSVLDAALAGAEPEATDGHWPDVNVGNPAPEVKP
jgi:hypothetical protein